MRYIALIVLNLRRLVLCPNKIHSAKHRAYAWREPALCCCRILCMCLIDALVWNLIDFSVLLVHSCWLWCIYVSNHYYVAVCLSPRFCYYLFYLSGYLVLDAYTVIIVTPLSLYDSSFCPLTLLTSNLFGLV